MTARDELTALIAPGGVGLCPKTCRDTGKGQHAHDVLDAIARLATDPETAPVVFRWLVKAGVLAEGSTPLKAARAEHSCKWCQINYNHPKCPQNADEPLCPHCGCEDEDVTCHREECPTVNTCAQTEPTLPRPWHPEVEWLQGETWTSERWRQHLAEAHS